MRLGIGLVCGLCVWLTQGAFADTLLKPPLNPTLTPPVGLIYGADQWKWRGTLGYLVSQPRTGADGRADVHELELRAEWTPVHDGVLIVFALPVVYATQTVAGRTENAKGVGNLGMDIYYLRPDPIVPRMVSTQKAFSGGVNLPLASYSGDDQVETTINDRVRIYERGAFLRNTLTLRGRFNYRFDCVVCNRWFLQFQLGVDSHTPINEMTRDLSVVGRFNVASGMKFHESVPLSLVLEYTLLWEATGQVLRSGNDRAHVLGATVQWQIANRVDLNVNGFGRGNGSDYGVGAYLRVHIDQRPESQRRRVNR